MPHKKTTILTTILIIFAFLTTANAAPVTIDFSDNNSTSSGFMYVGSNYFNSGFRISSDRGYLAYWGSGFTSGFKGEALFDNTTGAEFQLRSMNGDPFTLHSIDLTTLYNNPSSSANITFKSWDSDNNLSGTQTAYADNDWSTTTFDSTFSNITAVRWNQAYGGTSHQFDNITVDPTPPAPVPISSTIFLFGTGLVSLIASRRNKNQLSLTTTKNNRVN